MTKGFISCLLFLIQLQLCAQNVPQVSTSYLIRGAMITTQPNMNPKALDILIKDGIIIEVGNNLQVDASARIIKGDSMFVYPGFIAASSQVGIAKPKEKTPPKVDRTGYPPNEVAGITPENQISDIYDPKEGSISSMRQQGFGITHTLPYGNMMPGQTAIISLNGKAYNDAVIVPDYAQFSQFKGSGRMFPGTTIGVMAKWREMYHNADLANQHAKRFKNNPLHRNRPNHDPATQALIPVVEKQQSVFFQAENHLDIHRALQLQRDMGMKMVIVEAKRGEMTVAKAKSQQVPLLISLDLPKAIKKDKSAKDSTSFRALSKKELLKRQTTAIKEYEQDASKIVMSQGAAGFSFMGVKEKDILPNIRRMIANGLSEQNALANLTTLPSQLLGIDKISGTIEKGKIANLVISSKPIFEKDAKIAMVMVDGHLHKYDTKKKKKTETGEGLDIAGSWSYTIKVPGMESTGTMIIKKSDELYNIAITNSAAPGENYSAEGVALEGDSMSYTYNANIQGNAISLTTDITFDGDSLEGTVSVAEFGSFPIEGSKDSNPE